MEHCTNKIELLKRLVECFFTKFVNRNIFSSENEKEFAYAKLKRVMFISIFNSSYTDTSTEKSLRTIIHEMRAVGKEIESERLVAYVNQLPCNNDQILGRYQLILRFLMASANIFKGKVNLTSMHRSSVESEVDGCNTSKHVHGNCSLWYKHTSCQNASDLLFYAQELFENIDAQIMTEPDIRILISMLGLSSNYFLCYPSLSKAITIMPSPGYDSLAASDANFACELLPSRMESSAALSYQSDVCKSREEMVSDDDASAEIPNLLDSSRSSGIFSSDSMSVALRSSGVSMDGEPVYSSMFDLRNVIEHHEYHERPEKMDKCDETVLCSSSFSACSNSFIDLGIEFPVSNSKVTVFSWENKGRSMLLSAEDYHYVTEMGPKAFSALATCIDGLHINPLNSIPSQYLLGTDDVKNLLIGISSRSFTVKKSIDGHAQILLCPALANLGEPFYHHASALFDICKLYIKLREFCRTFSTIRKSCEVIKAAKSAVQRYLWFYENTVISADITGLQPVECFVMLFFGLRSHLRCFIKFCDMIDKHCEARTTGIKLLSMLCQLVDWDFNQLSSLNYVLLIKHCFQPYFNFLEHWLFGGSFNDNILDYNIAMNETFSYVKDERYWTSYFTMETDDEGIFTPAFLKEIALDIFICGKSYNLLRLCCPDHPLFSATALLPVFSLGFSNERIAMIEKKNILTMIERISVMLENLEVSEDISSTVTLSEEPSTDYLQDFSQEDPIVKTRRKKIMLLQMKNDLLTTLKNVDVGVEHVDITELNSRFGKTENILLKENDDDEVKWNDDYLTGDKVVNALIAKLAAYLNDNWGDGKDVVEYLQKKCIFEPLNQSIFSLAQTQVDLVNRCILEFYFVDLNLYHHFEEITKFFFLRDGNFADLLCQEIFTLDDFFGISTPMLLHEILQRALSNSSAGPSVQLLSLTVRNPPKLFPKLALNVVEHLQLIYSVGFPCNVIINQLHMEMYSDVFICLLQIQLVVSRLQMMWFHMKNMSAKNSEVVKSSQYRKLQQWRHEMLHFVGMIKAYFNYMTLEVHWVEFQNNMRERVKNIDDLRWTHDTYVKQCFKVCLLSKSDKPMHVLLKEILTSVLLFYDYVIEGNFVCNPFSNKWEHPDFFHMMRHFENFKSNRDVLFQAFVDLFPKIGFLVHMECFSTLFNFNQYYNKI